MVKTNIKKILKNLWLHTVRAYISIGMFFYFKRIEVFDVHNVPKDKPVLFLGNHQNALLDPLLIAVKCGRFSYFLTRASVFKKELIRKLLMSLQMLPVYRVRDGWNNITNNTTIFNTCTELLNKNQAIVMFPEGNHNLARRVRPLSKGFTRIVFDSIEKHPNLDLQIVPVGLNFVNAPRFADSAALYFGEPIDAQSFVQKNRHVAVASLKKKIKTELSQLTTDIPLDKYEEIIALLDLKKVNYLRPKEINACIKSGSLPCDLSRKDKNKLLKKCLKLLMIISVILPYVIWKFLIESKIEEAEFIATFRFAVAITLVPFYLVGLGIFLSLSISLLAGFLYVSIAALLVLTAIKL